MPVGRVAQRLHLESNVVVAAPWLTAALLANAKISSRVIQYIMRQALRFSVQSLHCQAFTAKPSLPSLSRMPSFERARHECNRILGDQMGYAQDKTYGSSSTLSSRNQPPYNPDRLAQHKARKGSWLNMVQAFFKISRWRRTVTSSPLSRTPPLQGPQAELPD